MKMPTSESVNFAKLSYRISIAWENEAGRRYQTEISRQERELDRFDDELIGEYWAAYEIISGIKKSRYASRDAWITQALWEYEHPAECTCNERDETACPACRARTTLEEIPF